MNKYYKGFNPYLLILIILVFLSPILIEAESITSLEKIILGGMDQWIVSQSEDFSKPVLLVLHGGPGYAMMPLLHEINYELESHFIVVNWDQRGAGKSYSPNIPRGTMNLKQFISDAHELTNILKVKFNKKKIYLLGHSLGTVLGILLIDKYPEDYFGFVGAGQVVNIIENEQMSYDFALTKATINNNYKAINELKEIGRPDNDGEYQYDSGYDITMKWVGYFGGDLFGKRNTDEIEEQILNSKIYAGDEEKIEDGWDFSQEIFNDVSLWYLDLKKEVTRVDVPVYFFIGRHDYDTPSKLVEEYFDIIDAPIKEIIWFENSAHFPFYENPVLFNNMMINKVIGDTFPGIN